MNSPPYTHLRKDFQEDIVAPAWPVGTHPALFDADQHAIKAHDLLAAAYSLGGGYVGSFETWWPTLRDDPEYNPAVFFLALDQTERVIGLAQCWTSAFLKDLAVSEPWRRKGLGKALLLQAFGYFERQGNRHFDLKVEKDNPSGAERLYRRLGMRPVV